MVFVMISMDSTLEGLENPCQYYKVGDPVARTFHAIGVRKGEDKGLLHQKNDNFIYYQVHPTKPR